MLGTAARPGLSRHAAGAMRHESSFYVTSVSVSISVGASLYKDSLLFQAGNFCSTEAVSHPRRAASPSRAREAAAAYWRCALLPGLWSSPGCMGRRQCCVYWVASCGHSWDPSWPISRVSLLNTCSAQEETTAVNSGASAIRFMDPLSRTQQERHTTCFLIPQQCRSMPNHPERVASRTCHNSQEDSHNFSD